MGVRLEDRRRFAAAPATLFAQLTDPAFQEARSRHLGTRSCRCEVERRGPELVVRLDEVRDTGWEPHRFESRRTLVWNVARLTARWRLEQTGGPGHTEAHGTLAILETADGCLRHLKGQLTIRVPLLGRMIEGLVRHALRREHDRDAEFVRKVLDQRAG